ncbi:LacI family DNA-binding transcriptional regulator [Microbacterium sp. Kw_RZR3]|jgi:LacI family transcriptional regulator|uniref:LacI family DNA-binding transcriptional regulator n=1 Tax=unclassified Microbacterium TaxID=2609290 RepID=UPI0023DB0FCC|nr:LacI family DNA-binding transcriptional regulator [Microbacterium sp. Kw_RZR3]MDF2048280.1 LacI family DNA-binding transcriptional regulator [Microbacterium sp. Kw_RZR3]MDF2917278.1 LacI family transcriptional regulator [Microbacterium sp.]
MTRRPTVRDVADAAGVSVATVSRALSGARAVKPEHRERVAAVAAQLGYRPHSVARALRRARTGVVGMVVPRIDNPFFPQVVSGVERALQAHALALFLCSSDDDVDTESSRLDVLIERQVDGILVVPCSQTASAPALEAAREAVPLVQIDQRVPTVAAPFVGIDDSTGIDAVIRHLTASGRRRLAFVGADPTNWSGGRRLEGFTTWAQAHDASATRRVADGDFSRESGRAAAFELLSRDGEIDALVCANDLIALGALDAASDLGRTVPGDLAITGFDDISIATACRPTLTTVRQPVAEIVSTSVATLLALINDQPAPDETLLPVELIVRGSA